MDTKDMKEFFISTIQIIGIVLLAIVIARRSLADDVFNFYFQKGSAPGTVIQGGGGQATTQATPLQNSTVPTAPVIVQPPQVIEQPKSIAAPMPHIQEVRARNYKPYNVVLGYTHLDDAIGSANAYTLGLQYNFNKFLGARLQAHLTAPESEKPLTQLADSNESSNRYGGFTSLVFTPLHMELVGHQMLDFSLHGGLMSYREKGSLETDTSGYEVQRVKTDVKGFLGASALFSLNENLGFEAFASILDGGKLGRVTGSAVIRF